MSNTSTFPVFYYGETERIRADFARKQIALSALMDADGYIGADPSGKVPELYGLCECKIRESGGFISFTCGRALSQDLYNQALSLPPVECILSGVNVDMLVSQVCE